MTRSLSVLFLAACVGGGPALAQDAPPPPQIDAAMPAPATVERGTRAAGASFLARRFGVSEAEAQRRLALDEQIAAATQALREAYGDDLVGLFIDHEPNYRVTYVFSREVAAGEVQQQIDGALRPHAAVRRSRFGTREIAALTQRVADLLVQMKLGGTVGYDYRTDMLEVTGASETGQRLVGQLPVDLRPIVRFVPGGVPKATQTGARAGDTFQGGWQYFPAPGTGTPTCTYAFSVRTGDGQGAISTASTGHCQGNAAYKYPDGHSIVLPTPPYLDKFLFNTSGRSYDYRVAKTGTITPGSYVWFWNNRTGSYYQNTLNGWQLRNWANVNPAYTTDGGYAQVTGVVLGSSSNTSNYNHPAGQVRCIGGQTTGITCGTITLSSATAVEVLPDNSARQYLGYVKVESQDYMVLSYGGDSGGPVVTEPAWNSTAGYYQVKAAGIMLIGSIRDRGDGYERPCVIPEDGSCPAYYMPIDRINDHLGVTVLTTSGAVSPQ